MLSLSPSFPRSLAASLNLVLNLITLDFPFPLWERERKMWMVVHRWIDDEIQGQQFPIPSFLFPNDSLRSPDARSLIIASTGSLSLPLMPSFLFLLPTQVLPVLMCASSLSRLLLSRSCVPKHTCTRMREHTRDLPAIFYLFSAGKAN